MFKCVLDNIFEDWWRWGNQWISSPLIWGFDDIDKLHDNFLFSICWDLDISFLYDIGYIVYSILYVHYYIYTVYT